MATQMGPMATWAQVAHNPRDLALVFQGYFSRIFEVQAIKHMQVLLVKFHPAPHTSDHRLTSPESQPTETATLCNTSLERKRETTQAEIVKLDTVTSADSCMKLRRLASSHSYFLFFFNVLLGHSPQGRLVHTYLSSLLTSC